MKKARQTDLSYRYVQVRNGKIRCNVPALSTAKSKVQWVSKVNGRPFKDALEAHNYAVRYREKLKEGLEAPAPQFRLGEAVDRFIREESITKGQNSQTVSFYSGHLNRLRKHWGEQLPLHRLTRELIKERILERTSEVKAGTVRAEYRALVRIIHWATEEGFIGGPSPLRGLTRILPKNAADHEEKLARFDPGEVPSLIRRIRESEGRDSAFMAELVTLFFYTGLRLTGVSVLRRCDVDLKEKLLRTTDKGKRVTVYLNDPVLLQAVTWLLENVSESETLVGRSKSSISHLFQNWKKALKEPRLQPHALKRAYADFHEKQGESMRHYQAITRHAVSTVALKYAAKGSEEHIRASVGAMSQLLDASQPHGPNSSSSSILMRS